MEHIEHEVRRILKSWGRGKFHSVSYDTEQVFIRPTNGWTEAHRVAIEEWLQDNFHKRVLVSHICTSQ